MSNGGVRPLDMPGGSSSGKPGHAGGGGGQFPPPEDLIEQKHQEYLKASRWHRRFYYATRLVAGMPSVLLPFVVSHHPTLATTFSVLIALAVALDFIVDPKGKWQLYSRATDLLAIARYKARGQYEKHQEQLDILLATEGRKLEQLIGVEDLLKKIRETK
ncbi:MAG: hypothetical protein Q8R91_10785 [Candidatus Omnitrophota bacterium]|nr:hypothetical protein [Candidatus Omnitrophota bacterium]